MKRTIYAILGLVIIVAVTYAGRHSLARYFGFGEVEYGVDHRKLTHADVERLRAEGKTIGMIENPNNTSEHISEGRERPSENAQR